MSAAQTERLRWYCFRTKPQREKMVRDTLRRFGLVAFIAIEKRLRHQSPKAAKLGQRRELRDACSAPGYVLVGHPVDQPFPWYTVFRWHFVHSVVSMDGKPAELREDRVRDFLHIEEANLPDHLRWFRTDAEPFGPGDLVEVHGDHIFRSQKLVVEDIREGEAIFGLVFFGKRQEVSVPLSQCVKAVAA